MGKRRKRNQHKHGGRGKSATSTPSTSIQLESPDVAESPSVETATSVEIEDNSEMELTKESGMLDDGPNSLTEKMEEMDLDNVTLTEPSLDMGSASSASSSITTPAPLTMQEEEGDSMDIEESSENVAASSMDTSSDTKEEEEEEVVDEQQQQQQQMAGMTVAAASAKKGPSWSLWNIVGVESNEQKQAREEYKSHATSVFSEAAEKAAEKGSFDVSNAEKVEEAQYIQQLERALHTQPVEEFLVKKAHKQAQAGLVDQKFANNTKQELEALSRSNLVKNVAKPTTAKQKKEAAALERQLIEVTGNSTVPYLNLQRQRERTAELDALKKPANSHARLNKGMYKGKVHDALLERGTFDDAVAKTTPKPGM